MSQIQNYIKSVEEVFDELSNPKIALGQSAYMKNLFDYQGITSPIRREAQKIFLDKKQLPSAMDSLEIAAYFWRKKEREYQYFAQELLQKHIKNFQKEDINLLEHLITHKSWWDTIDFIAPKLLSEYFKKFPETRDLQLKIWLESGNIWLQRSCLIYQLKYKEDTDTEILHDAIVALLGSKEFFINKAIGWILREYGKTNPTWVKEFVASYEHKLANLSKREALRRF